LKQYLLLNIRNLKQIFFKALGRGEGRRCGQIDIKTVQQTCKDVRIRSLLKENLGRN